jgi:hypothetical protein
MLCYCCGAPAAMLATFYGESSLFPFDVLLCERCRNTITYGALDAVGAGLMFVRPVRPAPSGWKCPGCGAVARGAD